VKVAALVLLLAATGQERPQATATLDTTATAVGGRLQLTVEVEDSPGWVVEPPARNLDLSPFRIRSLAEVPRESGRAYELTLVPLEAGEVAVPEVPFRIRGPGGTTGEITTAPVPVTVASNLAPPEAETAEDGAPPGPPVPPQAAGLKPPLEAKRNWWPVVAAGALLLLGAVAGFFLLRRLRNRKPEPEEEERAPRKPLRPAWELALEELDRIASARYVENGELDRQYVEVTDAVRRYLENRYGVPALECTTADLNELLRSAPVSPQTVSHILSLLREADLVKFAKAEPLVEDARATDDRARRLVADTTPRPAPAPPDGAEVAA
jgi:hypothetical protein